MIWHLIRRALRFLWRAILFALIPPPARAERFNPAPIDATTPCPVCGHRGSKLQCVVNQGAATAHDKAEEIELIEEVACQHCCDRCGARWFEKSVYEQVTGKKPEVTV